MGPVTTHVVKVFAPLLLAMLTIVFLLGLCLGAVQQDEEVDLAAKLTRDRKLTETPFLTFNPRGIRWCAEECYRRPRCNSFNFKMTGLVCELITKSISQCSKVDETGTFYGDSSAWPGTKQGSCHDDSCGENFMCAKDANNRDSCLPAECSSPPDVSNAEPIRTFVEIGSSTTYTCNAGFSMVGDSIVKCMTNTNWTSPDFSCS